MGFFQGPVLRNCHARCSGGHGPAGGERLQGIGRHVFKLGGDRIAQLCQSGQPLCISVAGLHMVVAHQPRRALRVRVQYGREVAQPLRRMYKHASQLATPHHTQCGGLA